ncbi:hypothetical protein Tco_1553984 [Tanacetum coccineum]
MGVRLLYVIRVPLKTLVDYENFANGIEMGTYEVWSKLTSQQRKAILKTASAGWTTLMELKSATPDLGGSPKTFASVLNPGLGAAGASAKDQPKVNLNFRPLVADPVFDGVNISIPRKVVEKADLVDVVLLVFLHLRGMILPKKPSMLSINGGHPGVMYVRYLVIFKIIALKRRRVLLCFYCQMLLPPTVCEELMKVPNGCKKEEDERERKEEKEEEAVENVYDEMANIFPNTKTGGSSSFTVAAG